MDVAHEREPLYLTKPSAFWSVREAVVSLIAKRFGVPCSDPVEAVKRYREIGETFTTPSEPGKPQSESTVRVIGMTAAEKMAEAKAKQLADTRWEESKAKLGARYRIANEHAY